MLRPRFVARMVLIVTQVLSASVIYGQDYPNKPIRIVSSGAAGGGDFVARLIVQGISEPLGQRVIVDNRGGVIAGLTVAKAPPDGYTLLMQSGALWIGPLLQKTAYDPVKDFSPITLAASVPNILVVHPAVPVKSVKDLIALAKARPGELNYGSGATGASNHLAGELFNSMAGVKIVRVAYKGIAPAIIGLIGGEVHVTFGSIGSVAPHIESGKLKALAVTSAQPSPLFPGLITVAASGLPGYESASKYGVFAPAGTPATIITRLNREFVRVIRQPDIAEKILADGSEPVGSSPEELAATIKSEMIKWGKLIKEAGISVN